MLYIAAFFLATGTVCYGAYKLGYRMVSDRNPKPGESGAPSQAAVAPRDSDLEGYAWALDNGIEAEAGCVNGSRAFIDGCKRAVRRRNESAKPTVQGR
jgi:hypothetical protein